MAVEVTKKTIYLLLLYKICGIAIFMKGFFPIKKNSSGFSSVNVNGSKVHDRLIIIMIDALRADFVFGDKNYMTFTKKLIEQGNTFSYTAHSHPPTVTMPRIKAITTGTIPGFIDVVLNVDSKELLEDNIITQMKMSNLTINFFGDDTWIKLFPNHFKRTDGTTSFFVTDYTEVDNNVTRHLTSEMARKDWHVTILHYLGLDHIGHLAGPGSELLKPKLNEMDNIIQMIYTTVVKQDEERNISTLIVLCGDHGMSDGGSHGGSSKHETTTPLVFMGSSFLNGQGRKNNDSPVNQIDIAPTLSLLMGLSIPKNSIGILTVDLFSAYSSKQRLEALRMNALQIFEVFRVNVKDSIVIELNQAMKFHNEWLMHHNNGTDSFANLEFRAVKISQIYVVAMQTMTDQLSRTMSSYDNYALYIGLWMLVQSILGTIYVLNNVSFSLPSFTTGMLVGFLVFSFTMYSHLHLCSTQYLGSSEVLCSFSFISILISGGPLLSTVFTITILFFVVTNVSSSGVYNIYNIYFQKSQKEMFLILGLLLHNISLFSSSFIEEEQQTWYFLTTTYHLYLSYYYLQDTLYNHTNNEKTSDEDLMEQEYRSRNNKTLHHNYLNIKKINIEKKVLFMFLILLCCDRMSRSWNQTGIKWADQADIGDWLVKPENKPILSYVLVFTLIIITTKIYLETRKFVISLIFGAGGLGVYVYRGVTGAVYLLPWKNNILAVQAIKVAQCVHFGVIFIVSLSLTHLLNIGQNKKGKSANKLVPTGGELFLIGYLLLILLLLRPHNIPLVTLTLIQAYIHHHLIWKRCESILEIVLSAYFLGWFTYFSQGNSNSLATVDIAAGYVGLQQNYSPIFVGVLSSLATFSGPLFWMISALIFITEQEHDSLSCKLKCRQFCLILLLIKTINITVCAVVSWFNCYHLFVWSVFSPKILYEGVISIVFAIFILFISIIC